MLKTVRKTLFNGGYYNGVVQLGERWGSTQNTTRKSGDLEPRSRAESQWIKNC